MGVAMKLNFRSGGLLAVGMALLLMAGVAGAVDCKKVRACINNDCGTWIVCDDGTVYRVDGMGDN